MKQCKCYHLLQFIHRFLSRKCKYASLLPPVLFSRTRKYRASWCPFVPCSIDFLYYTVNVKHTGDLIRGWPSFLRTCLNILDPPTLQQKSACAHKLFGLSIPSATMVPQLTSMQEKTESPQILNSALLHQCTGLESIGSTGSLWLSNRICSMSAKCFPLSQELMDPAAKPALHRNGSTSVIQDRNSGKKKLWDIGGKCKKHWLWGLGWWEMGEKERCWSGDEKEMNE